MKKIIAATDFSAVAENAVEYACGLALDIDAEVVLLHAFFIPVTFADTPMPVVPVDEAQEAASERMDLLLQGITRRFPTVKLSTRIMYGDIVDCLDELTQEGGAPFMVVMGNNGEQDDSFLMSSELLKALKDLKVAVMGIPADARYSRVRQICLAYDVSNIEEDLPLDTLGALVNATNARLHVLHISADNRQTDNQSGAITVARLHDWLSELQPEFHYLEDQDIDAAIVNFTYSKNMDWLIMTPHKYSVFERLFHKSHTKTLVRKVNIPVLALHRED